MTTPLKQKVSVSLDADLVAAFEGDGPLSTQINDALRAALDRRRHLQDLGELLSELDRRAGPLDTPEDEAAVQRYVDLLT